MHAAVKANRNQETEKNRDGNRLDRWSFRVPVVYVGMYETDTHRDRAAFQKSLS